MQVWRDQRLDVLHGSGPINVESELVELAHDPNLVV
jgi:hypothetical protein